MQRALWSSIADRVLAIREHPSGRAALSAFAWLARLVAVAVLVAFGGVLVDALARRSFARIDVREHLAASLSLYAAFGALMGFVGWAATTLADALARPLEARRPRLGAAARAALYAAACAAALSGTSFWLFSGRAAQRGVVGAYGPYLLLGAAAACGFVVAWTVRWALLGVAAGRSRGPVLVALTLGVGGVLFVAVDLNVLVSLYARLHTALEAVAAALLVCAGVIGASLAARRYRALAWAERALCALALVWAAFLSRSPKAQTWIEESLHHAGAEPVDVGRMLRRMQAAAAWTKREHTAEGKLAATGLDELLERYDADAATRDPAWDAPLVEPAPHAARLKALRDGTTDYNIVVYYVDTLRQDVAYDEEAMPNVARFAQKSVKFENAYSSGSDTLRALPALMGGTYDLGGAHPGGLLEVARRNELPTTLFIAESAHEFLAKLFPGFAFDEVNRFADYAQGGVWGYGADRPTAGPLVSRALEWMSERGQKRFFAFLFNFDVHNWRELNKEHVYGAADALHVPDEGRWNWRYRVVARSVDEQFGRLMKGLDDLGLTDRTIVLFVSDHGEALNYHGFWVHSIFLWEPLVRVPLMLRVPGIEPEVVKDRVSIVDVAPTLARFMEPDPPMVGYHGEDLLGALVPGHPKRRLPILLASVADQQLARIGIINGDFKLVLPLDWCEPQLYDLRAPDPDDADIAPQKPAATMAAMSQLLRSPVFVNAYEGLKAREAKPPQ